MQKLPIIDKYYKPIYWVKGMQPSNAVVLVIKKPEFLSQLESKILDNGSKSKN